MKKLILAALLTATTLSPAYAKSSKITECKAIFSTTLSEAGSSSDYDGGAKLTFDIENKGKKAIYAIDGVVFVQAKGDKGSFIFTDTLEWAEGLEQGDSGWFDIHVSPTGMTLAAIASDRPVSITYGMHHATILYEDGTIRKCGDHNAFVIPLIPYF